MFLLQYQSDDDLPITVDESSIFQEDMHWPKFQIFTWLMFLDRIPTRRSLVLNLIFLSVHYIYDVHEESINHLFFLMHTLWSLHRYVSYSLLAGI
uniref:Reverse transcriptase zinc-binding domain-containing protein n=1 Tax=Glycine max TaxID=3847 RepID=A0A0R0EWP3_SOYBN